MTRSDSLAALAAALAKAQGAILPAPKNATNPHYRSHYADLGSVWDACRSTLAAHGLSIVQSPTDAGEGRVGLTTTILHSSGEWLSSSVSTRLAKDDAQGVGSALTYLRRYALAATVGVTTTEDDDGEAAARPHAAPRVERVAVAAPQSVAPRQVAPAPQGAIAAVAAAVERQSASAEGSATGPVCWVGQVDEQSGTTKAGKPYTRWRISFDPIDQSQSMWTTTFSITLAELARDAKAAGKCVHVEANTTKFGLDLVGLTLAEGQAERAAAPVGEEIPF